MIDILVCDDSAEIVEQVKKLLCAWEKVNTVSFNIDCRQSGKFILKTSTNMTLLSLISRCPK